MDFYFINKKKGIFLLNIYEIAILAVLNKLNAKNIVLFLILRVQFLFLKVEKIDANNIKGILLNNL